MSQIRFEHEEGSEIRVPRWALASMGGLVGVALALAAIASLTGFGAVENPTSITGGEVLLTFAFQPQEDGSLTVVRHPEGDPIQTVAPGEGGFLRGVVRPLERERVRLDAAPATAPYQLTRSPEGTLVLRDPSTGVLVDLAAFGSSSIGAFRALVDAAAPPVSP
jgi:putative photosynthetic complex assembly protein